METTLDLQGLRKERVEYLKGLIELWKKQDQQLETKAPSPDMPMPIVKRRVDPAEFLVVKSHVIGGEFTRAMAYDD